MILAFLLFYLPAFIANMTPPFLRHLPFGYPLDCYKTYRGKRVFGEHKTWRGLIAGTITGGVTAHLLGGAGVGILPWQGYVLGFTALVGDAIKSFFKRQRGTPAGESWVPFDQLDFFIAAFLVSLLFTSWPWGVSVLGFVLVFVGTVIVQVIAGATGIKKNKL